MSAQFGAMRTGLSALVIAMADRNASASLSAAAALSQASLQLVPLYVFVRTHQKEMFASYQQLKTNFTAAVTALRVSVTAALAKIDLRSALIPKLGAVVARQLQLCYRLVPQRPRSCQELPAASVCYALSLSLELQERNIQLLQIPCCYRSRCVSCSHRGLGPGVLGLRVISRCSERDRSSARLRKKQKER